jgi:hypothetical protein
MPTNCSVPPVLPVNAKDIQIGDFLGDKSDEFIYTIESKIKRAKSYFSVEDPIVQLMITLKTTDSKGQCTWTDVLLHEQNLRKLGVEYVGGGWGSPGSAIYAGYKFLVADFNGDGIKEIQTYKADKNKLTPIYYISDLVSLMREKLDQMKKVPK